MRLREVRRARVLLTSSGLAPGSADTLRELTDEELRPRQPGAPLPDEALRFMPDAPLRVDPEELKRALRARGRGSAPDLSGTRYEHLRVLLEDETAWAMFVSMADDFA